MAYRHLVMDKYVFLGDSGEEERMEVRLSILSSSPESPQQPYLSITRCLCHIEHLSKIPPSWLLP